MSASPITDQMIAALRDALASKSGTDVEQRLVNQTITATRGALPHIKQADLGEALMHVTPIFTSMQDRIREYDPTLTDRECIHIILNVLAIAGARMHVGARR